MALKASKMPRFDWTIVDVVVKRSRKEYQIHNPEMKGSIFFSAKPTKGNLLW